MKRRVKHRMKRRVKQFTTAEVTVFDWKREEVIMTMEERVNRINELYHKSKGVGLSEAEKAEQAKLRREYIDSIKASVTANMEHVSIKHPDGTLEKVTKREH